MGVGRERENVLTGRGEKGRKGERGVERRGEGERRKRESGIEG